MREKRRTTLAIALSVIAYIYAKNLPIPIVDTQIVNLYIARTFSFLFGLMSLSYLIYLNFMEWLARGDN